MEIHVDELASPIGNIVLAETGGALCALDFETSPGPVLARLQKRLGTYKVGRGNGVRGYRDRLEAYFQGELSALDGLAVATGGTAFQRDVWAALQRIPAGSTTSYSELAAAIGRPSAVRAVGMANSRNPIAVVIPCHRVIGRDGSLTGYAGGLDRKRWLLRHEGCLPQGELSLF